MEDFAHINEVTKLIDIRGALNDGYRTRRNYYSNKKHKKPPVARFKARFDFIDSNSFYPFSYDFHKVAGNETVCDEYLGLSALLYQRHEWSQDGGRVRLLRIWANMTDRVARTDEKKYDVLIYEWSPNYEWTNPFIQYLTKHKPHTLLAWKPGGKELYESWHRKRMEKVSKKRSKTVQSLNKIPMV